MLRLVSETRGNCVLSISAARRELLYASIVYVNVDLATVSPRDNGEFASIVSPSIKFCQKSHLQFIRDCIDEHSESGGPAPDGTTGTKVHKRIAVLAYSMRRERKACAGLTRSV